MTEHRLKIDSKWYHAVKNGFKNFEIRKNDRDYKIGDTVILTEWDYERNEPKTHGEVGLYQNNESAYTIKYILTRDDFPQGIRAGYVIMSLEALE